MKIIKYKMLVRESNHGTEENPDIVRVFQEKQMVCGNEQLETNEEIAKTEAYDGVYTVEDDGQPDPVRMPSQLDVIEAQLVYTAMMTDTLLEV